MKNKRLINLLIELELQFNEVFKIKSKITGLTDSGEYRFTQYSLLYRPNKNSDWIKSDRLGSFIYDQVEIIKVREQDRDVYVLGDIYYYTEDGETIETYWSNQKVDYERLFFTGIKRRTLFGGFYG